MGSDNTAAKRDSNFELYRIVLMLAIIAHHYVINSGLMTSCIDKDPTSGRSIFLLLFGAWGKAGINCFLMITGYFMCKSHITLRKFLKLFFEVEFYNIIIFIIFAVTGRAACNLMNLRLALLPISSLSTSFTSCFLVLFLLIPFINILISGLSKRSFQILLLLLLLFYTLLPSAAIITAQFNYVTWFVVVYLIAAYIRLYPSPRFDKGMFWLGMSIVCAIASYASVALLAYKVKGYYYFLLSDSNKIMAVATAISLFLFFKNLKIKYNPVINIMAQSVFGVFLIHTRSSAMRQWLWGDVLKCTDFFNSPYLVLHAVGSVVGIFLICTVIDQLRIHLIEKPLFKCFDGLISKCEELPAVVKGHQKTV